MGQHHIDFPAWGDWYDDTGFTRNVTSAAFGGGEASNGGTINDYIEYEVALDAGTWDYTLVYNKGTTRGIANVTIDGVSIGTIDMYSALNGKNTRVTITGFTVASSGVYPLRLTIDDKHTSGDYYAKLQYHGFDRTGA